VAEEVSRQITQIALTEIGYMSGEHGTDHSTAAPASSPSEPLCWICKTSKADSGEHKTKRSDLLAVLGNPLQKQPFFYSDIKRRNQVVGSLDAKILKSPVWICAHCNNTRTQPHDRAWERMSDRLRSRPLAVGRWVRCERIFRHFTKREMIAVHLYFLKLFGCMIAEAKANGHDVPIDLDAFSSAIMSGRPHLEVHLQFGRNDGAVGRSDLHCYRTDSGGAVLGGWLYQLYTIAVSVLYVQAGRFEERRDIWHSRSCTSAKRFSVADFMYRRRGAEGDGGAPTSSVASTAS
jgi:hypothetical protein